MKISKILVRGNPIDDFLIECVQSNDISSIDFAAQANKWPELYDRLIDLGFQVSEINVSGYNTVFVMKYKDMANSLRITLLGVIFAGHLFNIKDGVILSSEFTTNGYYKEIFCMVMRCVDLTIA